MQNPVNTNEFALISVPVELLEEAGICEGDVMQMFVEDGRLVIEPLYDDDDFLCDDDCANCPLADECDESEVF